MNLATQISFMNPPKGRIYCTEQRATVLEQGTQEADASETAASHAGKFSTGLGASWYCHNMA